MDNELLMKMKEAFKASFICEPQFIITSPGRVELGGNHTDHQQGRVLAAAIDMRITALVSSRPDNTVHIVSEGYPDIRLSLDEIDKYRIYGSSAALTAGVAKAFLDNGYNVGGFNAYLTSSLPHGGGLSSSASYEVLIGTIFNTLHNRSSIDAVKIAIYGQYAENEFFGKPSGLMDQLACAIGGINAIDFEDVKDPKINHIDFDFNASGYSVIIVSSGADHADLTGEYASITDDMASISKYFGKKVLRQISEKDFYANLIDLRNQCGDRAVMRAMHFFAENERVVAQANALSENKVDDFITLAGQSGRSSWMLLQNVMVGKDSNEGLALTLAICERALKGCGTCRVHGGGFGGAALVIAEKSREEELVREIESILGSGTCTRISIRSTGPEVKSFN